MTQPLLGFTLVYNPRASAAKSAAASYAVATQADTGYMPTRDLYSSKDLLVTNERMLFPTATIPRMFEGGPSGIGKQVNVDSNLRPEDTRLSRAADTDILNSEPFLDQFTPLIVPWEQPDDRILDPVNSRFEVLNGDLYPY
jgi:hypothetical protein